MLISEKPAKVLLGLKVLIEHFNNSPANHEALGVSDVDSDLPDQKHNHISHHGRPRFLDELVRHPNNLLNHCIEKVVV